MQTTLNVLITLALAGALIALLPLFDDGRVEADSSKPAASSSSNFSGDPNEPKRHFRVPNAADLDAQAARQSYGKLAAKMGAGYAISGDPVAKSYQEWKLHNTAPYKSATHGRRFVNNYANALARDYGKFEEAGILPQGAVIAKDSVMIAADGAMEAGPLFIMEKMAPGFNYVSGDWRYTMIMPDGSLFGVTRGENAERVEFCIGCHLAREQYDHLFFVPKALRAN